MGIDGIKLNVPLEAINILDERYFRQLYYVYKREGDDVKKSNEYLCEKEKLPSKNQNILDLVLKPRIGIAEVEFSSKKILSKEEYPNEGLNDSNYERVISDFNERAEGVYEIDLLLFLKSKIVQAEIFVDIPKDSFDAEVKEIIRALSLCKIKHKETRIYGGETFLSRSGGFSLKVYDKEAECMKKYLGKKHKDLNLNLKETLRIEIFGKNDEKSRGLRRKHFYQKKLEDLLSKTNQIELILDFMNELTFPRMRYE